ncbi:heavy metal translocating P-type ATPase [Noviherbaspirillum sp. CPCC 100848]|uniref:Heavy metal translocating P-type ATPase n=1 Tax=Noviherbaspirillum album TaxID=3080276 RepID=A0ABU6J7M5_9BURK|nr:heavy metal translocating P-type ATPase [Noviherbaspirillum sp. CPCC 100848]MEC4719350.1 heavy metal translocating P-type ATPase [Noviherbaspirillum sp. CPCC 100848]
MTAARHAFTEALACFHCGQDIGAGAHWSVRIADVDRAMCCPGCEAVARTIVDSGLSDYYLNREGYSPNAADASLVPEELRLYDAPEMAGQFAAGDGSDGAAACEAVFSVEGIRCAACVWLIERRLARLPGVTAFSLNVATAKLHVRWNPETCKPSDILLAVREVGYLAYPFDASRHEQQMQRAGKTLFRQLFIAGLSMMQVMMYAVPVYLATDGTLDADMEALMRWASLLLTIPAVCYSALPFFQGAWSNLKSRMLGMDVPVALGIAAAFAGSVAATLDGGGDVYFDSVTMFIFLLLCSRYLEFIARRKAASGLERLQAALPASAARMSSYPQDRTVEVVPAARLAEGEFVLVKPGEAFPADAVLVEGATSIDLSLLSGESQPLPRQAGDELPGGAVNASQPVVVKIARAARESTLSRLVKLVDRAGQAKPQLSLWADKVAAWFVAALLLLAVVVFIAWQVVDPARSWPIAIAVLVVSCPCALSLATPSALAAATDRLVAQGVLILQPHVLETLHRTTHVVFDKTGTLTKGKPVLTGTRLLGERGAAQCLQLAAALESGSAHPLAQAIAEAAKEGAGTPAYTATSVCDVAGKGIEASVDGVRYRLGTIAFVEELVGQAQTSMAAAPAPQATPVYLGASGKWLARFDLTDALREDAAQVVRQFQAQGKQVILLSGDRQDAAEAVAGKLGIDQALGEQLPEHKLAFVQALQKQGAVVAMVGDGINDAAVLRAADVSFAMGGGAALAQTHADAVLLSAQLGAVGDAMRAASQTMSVVRQNLAWASLYNALAIPAAAVGMLNPWLSGIGMSLSSAAVIINALRLRRVPRRRIAREAKTVAAAGAAWLADPLRTMQ